MCILVISMQPKLIHQLKWVHQFLKCYTWEPGKSKKCDDAYSYFPVDSHCSTRRIPTLEYDHILEPIYWLEYSHVGVYSTVSQLTRTSISNWPDATIYNVQTEGTWIRLNILEMNGKCAMVDTFWNLLYANVFSWHYCTMLVGISLWMSGSA